jgi:iron complex transport system permease protein
MSLTLAARSPGTAALTTRRRRARLAIPVLAVLLLVAMIASAGIGAFPIPAADVLAVLAHAGGIPVSASFTPEQEAILLGIRLPRVVLAALVGAALSVSGAVLQGLFRNPLADPALIGVSGGAALAAAAVIVLGAGSAWGGLLLPLCAFAGGLSATLFIYALAQRGGATVLTLMLLAGIAVNALSMAGIGLFSFLSSDEQLRNISFWTLGSLAAASWGLLATLLPFLAVGLAVLLRLAASLDALALGESQAGQLGVETRRVKRAAVLSGALLVGALTAVTGIISFVGLVAPHMVRMVCGPSHRVLLPASGLAGAVLVLAADSAARVVVAPAELPLGVLTALAGAPLFIALLLRAREGVWA